MVLSVRGENKAPCPAAQWRSLRVNANHLAIFLHNLAIVPGEIRAPCHIPGEDVSRRRTNATVIQIELRFRREPVLAICMR